MNTVKYKEEVLAMIKEYGTQEAVAKILGVTQSGISRFLCDNRKSEVSFV